MAGPIYTGIELGADSVKIISLRRRKTEYEVLGEDFDKIIYSTDTFVLKSDVEKFNPEYAAAMPDTIFFEQDMPSISMGRTLLFSLLEAVVVPE